MKKDTTSTSFDRISAFISDYIICFIPNMLLFLLFCCTWAFKMYPLLYPNSSQSSMAIFPLFVVIISIFPWFLIPGVLCLSILNFLFLISYFLTFPIIYSYFDSRKWGTLGKKKQGLMVCNLDNSNLSLPNAFKRNFIKFFFFATLPFLLLPFWGGGTQGLHDKICGTKVVYRYDPNLKCF